MTYTTEDCIKLLERRNLVLQEEINKGNNIEMYEREIQDAEARIAKLKAGGDAAPCGPLSHFEE